jgi:hypothetical protein
MRPHVEFPAESLSSVTPGSPCDVYLKILKK